MTITNRPGRNAGTIFFVLIAIFTAMHNADYFVKNLNLQPHPEGGWYKETYRSEGDIAVDRPPADFSVNRSISTAIYFLLEGKHFSAFHRIKSDEMWHFYEGGTLHVYVIHLNGLLEIIKLGKETDKGEMFQAVVPAGCWFASQPADEKSFSLVGCTVAPGFDFADFEMAKAGELVQQFPEHELLIRKLCRD